MSGHLLSPGTVPGGLRELLKIAIPAGVSQACFSLMMLTDRILLTPLGKEAPSASMLAGFSSFVLAVFFFGLLNYITPLVGQYIGSGRADQAGIVVHQGLLLTLCLFPFLALSGELAISPYLTWADIDPSQKRMAESYFSVINLSTVFSLANVVMSGFFSGIGQTQVVMKVNLTGMLLNIPLSYYFIHYGVFGYLSGIQGAALGSTVSMAIMSAFFLRIFLSSSLQSDFGTNLHLRWNQSILLKLLRFGIPSGVEMFLTFIAFSTFVALFCSYGLNEALSATIAFNWDIVAFMPVWGISIGLMSLVGRYMGASQLDYAIRSIKSGAIAAFSAMFLASVIFFTMTEALIVIFLPDHSEATYRDIVPLASVMLKLISLYCFANAANLVLSGALRASGDTKAVMYIAVCGQWLMIILSYCAIRIWKWDAVFTWGIWVSSLFVETILYSMRFFHGAWKKIKVV